jgi:hypothetical protein
MDTSIKVTEIFKLCEKAIVRFDEKLERQQNALGLLLGMKKSLELVSSKKIECRILKTQNNIKLVKVQKLIYKAVVEKNSLIFPKLMEKYDELMTTSLEIWEDLVLNEVAVEAGYLDYCKKCLKEREGIKMICEVFGDLIAK